MPEDDEPKLVAPPFVHACRVMDHLWMASNALSQCKSKKALRLQERVNEIRREFNQEVLPDMLRKETLG